MFNNKKYWALILGGSSGFGLATAKKLARSGMNICIVHRDRRGSLPRIEKDFEEIKASGVQFCSFNLDALSAEGRSNVLSELPGYLNGGKVRLLLHSIAFGNLKLLAPLKPESQANAAQLLADKLGLEQTKLQSAIDELFAQGSAELASVATPPRYDSELLLRDEELSETIYSMGTSLLSWTREIFANSLFANDARVIGLTSEGNEVSWYGYAAVSAAKLALESISRSIAREFAVHGIRSNIVQPGVTDTPALRLIPGNGHLMAHAKLKNPFGRLTTPEDVANVICLLASDEAAWINGALIRVDGGECISG
ncbi:MAG: SDR family oxidoreductase [Oligoflexia bacterium]|nr:SDR family oxidoreductase [Oligoflexia bacterium]